MKNVLDEIDKLDEIDDADDLDSFETHLYDEKYDCLKLENQICFPMYAASRSVITQYKTYLDGLGLTYTQYVVMMVLWEHKSMNVKEIGNHLFLDSGTLTPVLKTLEAKKLVKRKRSKDDERNIIVSITDKGESLKDKALYIPEQILKGRDLDDKEVEVLKKLLYKFIGGRTIEEANS